MLLLRCGLPALLSTAFAFSSHAQAVAPAADTPRVFVGLGAGYLAYDLPGQYAVRLPALVPTVGVVLSPRWSLQLSGAYHARTQAGHYTVTQFGPTGPGTNVTYGSTSTQRSWAVPLLARYALRAPARRWQVDLVGGVALVHDTFRRTATTDSAAVRTETTTSTPKLGVHLALGLGVRYALTPGLSLTGDALLTRALHGPSAPAFLAVPSVVVGLRYTLGRRE